MVVRIIFVIDVPIYHKYSRGYLGGFLDLLYVVDGVLYIVDYKPDLDPNIDAYGSSSFINCIPQLGSYVLMMKAFFGINDVKVVAFNDEAAWVFDAIPIFKKLAGLMSEHNPSNLLKWKYYFKF